MYRSLRVAVVIPAHNEACLLPVTLSGVPEYVDEVIVVDDASEDRTKHVALNHPRAVKHVISHPRNLGVGGAIVTGYRRAIALGMDAVVVMGADAQMDPDEMDRLLDPIVDGRADYVVGLSC